MSVVVEFDRGDLKEMGSMFKKFWQKIFGRTLTEEELYGRRMLVEDKDCAIESIKNIVAEEKLRLYRIEEEARRRQRELEAKIEKESRKNSNGETVRSSIEAPPLFATPEFALSGVKADFIREQVAQAKTFARTLLEYVSSRCEGKAKVCYARAGLSRQLYSKIISNPELGVKKRTVMQLCIGLKLPIEEANAFMAVAGYCFSKSNFEDMAFQWCIKNGVYNIFDVNDLLVVGACEPITIY
jgi:hypothetical protein